MPPREIGDLIWSPILYFRRLAILEEHPAPGVYVVLILVLLQIAESHFLESSLLHPVRLLLEANDQTAFASILDSSKSFRLILHILGSSSTLFYWIAGTIYAYACTVIWGDPGPSLQKMFYLFGRAFLPLLLFFLIAVPISFLYNPVGDLSALVAIHSQADTLQAVSQYVQSVQSLPALILLRDTEFFCELWVAALWVVILHAVFKLTRTKAFLIVGSWVALICFVAVFSGLTKP
jgi:hypothetical protein